MKQTLFLLIAFLTTICTYSQSSKEVTITGGQLVTTLTSSELTSVTNLTIKGTIDARDFKTMRDKMTALSVLNIENATIAAYSGTEGTEGGTSAKDYPANEVPTYAFYDYYKTSITSVSLPKTCTTIGMGAFLYCKKLETVTIPSSVSTIKSSAFNRCEKLTSITIPSSVTTIEKLAFSFSGLTSIALPETTINLENSIFLNCVSLASANIPKAITEIPEAMFSGCTKLATITLPAKTTKISDNAFYACESLKTINIPASVTEIGKYALNNCDVLASIYMNNSTPPTAGSNAFYPTYSKTKLYVPTGSKAAYSSASEWSWFNVPGYHDNIIEYTPSGITNENNVTITLTLSTKSTFEVNGLNGIGAYSIVNMEGKTIERGNISEKESISLNSFVNGTYIISISNDVNKASFKIIKK